MTEPLRAPRRHPAPEPGRPQRQRHLRAVPDRQRISKLHRRRRLVGVVGAALLATVVFGLVYVHVVMAQRQFSLDRLDAKAAQEQAHYQSLRLQVAQLKSPQRIISAAEGHLGMRQPASVTYLSPRSANAAEAKGGAVSQAPAGDANWPRIKADLAKTP